MLELHLIRDPDDHRRHDLAGVGTIRLVGGRAGQWAAEAPGHGSWRLKYRFIPRKVTTASDAGGNVMATFTERKRTLTTRGRELRFEGGARVPRSRWREPLVLVEGDRELARFECRTFSGKTKNQVEVTIVDERLAQDEPLLVLFAAFNAGMLAATLNGTGISYAPGV